MEVTICFVSCSVCATADLHAVPGGGDFLKYFRNFVCVMRMDHRAADAEARFGGQWTRMHCFVTLP
jgi:hypothetical protein